MSFCTRIDAPHLTLDERNELAKSIRYLRSIGLFASAQDRAQVLADFRLARKDLVNASVGRERVPTPDEFETS